jgi:hypothetical protein
MLACLTRLLLGHLVFREFVDDAYIYLRYCDNCDAGLGLVYNAGERVIAFTSTVTFERLGLAAAALSAVLCTTSTILGVPPRVAKVNEHVGDLSCLGERIEREYPDRSLMIGDIGIIGFTTELRIIDLAGLVSPVSLAQ